MSLIHTNIVACFRFKSTMQCQPVRTVGQVSFSFYFRFCDLIIIKKYSLMCSMFQSVAWHCVMITLFSESRFTANALNSISACCKFKMHLGMQRALGFTLFIYSHNLQHHINFYVYSISPVICLNKSLMV